MGRTNTIDYGLDLGTTTSLIAKFDDGVARIISNVKDNSDFIDSAVYIQKKNDNEILFVGEKAKNNLVSHPDDAYAEFKLRMGDKEPYVFKESGKKMLAEELSAEILKALKENVREQNGDQVSAVVITHPADFNQTNIHATMRAAELAGFEEYHLIQEPYAAALAYAYDSSEEDDGYWMVYDLGGGTFDVAIAKKIEDDFKIVSHEGDASLGGKLIDWDIVNKIFVSAIREEFDIDDFYQGNPKYRKQFAKLKREAELAKKDLSYNEESFVFLENFIFTNDGDWVDFEYDISREELKAIMDPYIMQTINSCYDALNKASLEPSDIKKIILVGNSTLSPVVKDALKKEFDIPLDYSIPPGTAVACGAAIHAGNKLKKQTESSFLENGKYFLALDYEPMGFDERFDVTYKVSPPEGESINGCTIEFRSKNSAWTTGKIPLTGRTSEVELTIESVIEENYFEIILRNVYGDMLELHEGSPNQIKYRKAVNPIKPTLIRTIGLGLSDNTLFTFAEEGETLPYDNYGYDKFYTEGGIKKGSNNKLVLPLYEGNNENADKNILIGELQITSDDIDYDLPKGSEIEFHVIISENEISYTALLVDFDEELNDVIELDRGLPSVSKLKELFDVERKRKTDLKKQSLYFEKNDSVEENFKRIEEEKIEERIDTLINSAENDRGSLDAADKKLKKFGEYLDLIEEILSEQEDIKNIIHSVEHWLKRIEPLVQKKGDFDQKIAFDDYKERFDDAKDEKDVEILKTILSSLWKLENEVDKVNKTVEKFFSFESQGDFDENKSEAEYYIEKGKEIIQDKDNLEYNIYELERINNQLLRLDGRFSNKEPDNMVYGVKRSKY